MKNRIFAIVMMAVFAFSAANGQTLTPERVNKIGRGRYTTAPDFQIKVGVVFTQFDYKFESRMPQGFGKKTARELGADGRKFWNDYPGEGAALVVMHADTLLIYDTVSLVPLYVTGCIREGKEGGINRIKEETPPTPVAAKPPLEPIRVREIVTVNYPEPGKCELSPKSITIKRGESVTFAVTTMNFPWEFVYHWLVGANEVNEKSYKLTRSFNHPETVTFEAEDELERISRCTAEVFVRSDEPGKPILAPPPPPPAKHKRHWLWKIPGFNCVYQFTVNIKHWGFWDDLERAGCAAGIVLGIELSAGGALYKYSFRVPGGVP